jgi:hypothetical protein
VSSLEEQLASARAEVAEERRKSQQTASAIADLKRQLVAANQTHVRQSVSIMLVLQPLPFSQACKDLILLD